MARKSKLTIPSDDEEDDELAFSFVSRPAAQAAALVRKIGAAIIGGDFSGNGRGRDALDFQAFRSLPDEVASGQSAVALGNQAKASATAAVAVGFNCYAQGQDSIGMGSQARVLNPEGIGIGLSTVVNANQGVALGGGCEARALRAVALGVGAIARVQDTANIGGALILRKGQTTPATDWLRLMMTAEIVIATGEINLKTVADQTLTLPTGCKFWLTTLGIIATNIAGLTTQPTIRYGITGNLAKHRAATITTLLTAAAKRETYAPLAPEDGETTLTAGVTVGAAGTTIKGRFYWQGLLVEDE